MPPKVKPATPAAATTEPATETVPAPRRSERIAALGEVNYAPPTRRKAARAVKDDEPPKKTRATGRKAVLEPAAVKPISGTTRTRKVEAKTVAKGAAVAKGTGAKGAAEKKTPATKKTATTAAKGVAKKAVTAAEAKKKTPAAKAANKTAPEDEPEDAMVEDDAVIEDARSDLTATDDEDEEGKVEMEDEVAEKECFYFLSVNQQDAPMIDMFDDIDSGLEQIRKDYADQIDAEDIEELRGDQDKVLERLLQIGADRIADNIGDGLVAVVKGTTQPAAYNEPASVYLKVYPQHGEWETDIDRCELLENLKLELGKARGKEWAAMGEQEKHEVAIEESKGIFERGEGWGVMAHIKGELIMEGPGFEDEEEEEV